MKLAKLLKKHDIRVVFAESCTAGYAAARLARTPGISQHLCGSFVVYRTLQKQKVLNLPQTYVDKYTTESEEVADWLAKMACQITEEAHWSASIVGHLGPDSPASKDGIVYISVRCSDGTAHSFEHKLLKQSRKSRMKEAAKLLLKNLKTVIEIHLKCVKIKIDRLPSE